MATLLLFTFLEEIAMPEAIPQVHEYMTPTPLTIGADQTLSHAISPSWSGASSKASSPTAISASWRRCATSILPGSPWKRR
jgi:hypothetical protein